MAPLDNIHDNRSKSKPNAVSNMGTNFATESARFRLYEDARNFIVRALGKLLQLVFLAHA